MLGAVSAGESCAGFDGVAKLEDESVESVEGVEGVEAVAAVEVGEVAEAGDVAEESDGAEKEVRLPVLFSVLAGIAVVGAVTKPGLLSPLFTEGFGAAEGSSPFGFGLVGAVDTFVFSFTESGSEVADALLKVTEEVEGFELIGVAKLVDLADLAGVAEETEVGGVTEAGLLAETGAVAEEDDGAEAAEMLPLLFSVVTAGFCGTGLSVPVFGGRGPVTFTPIGTANLPAFSRTLLVCLGAALADASVGGASPARAKNGKITIVIIPKIRGAFFKQHFISKT